MKFSALSKNSVFYTVMNTVEALVPLLLVPLLTRRITPSEYGYITLYVSYVGVLVPCIGLKLDDYVRMHFFENDAQGRHALLSKSLCLVSLVGLFGLGACMAWQRELSAWLSFPASWLWVIVASAFSLSLFRLLLAFNQFMDNKRCFLGLHLAYTGASLAMIVGLLLTGQGWISYPLGKVLGALLALVAGIFLFVPGFRLHRFSFSSLKPLLSFGLVYLPAGISLVAGGLIDRVLVAHRLGTEATGFYGVAALFGSALWLPILGFHHAWQPWLFRQLSDLQQHGRAIRRVSLCYIVGLPAFGVIVAAMSWWMAPLLIGEQYRSAFHLIPWAVATMILQGSFMHCQAFFHFYKATRVLSVGSMIFIAINLVLTIVLLKSHGLPGVFLATILAYAGALAFYGLVALCARLGQETGQPAQFELAA